MIDLSNLEQYRENNRLEAKKALGGLPESIWETYSAFANAMGGILLLGVEEHRDHTLHPVDLPDPAYLVEEFWALVNDPRKASVNILSPEHVQIQQAEGNRIITIAVPRAQRCDRPVYIDGEPFAGSYRRNGEGDYKCTREEVLSMLRDAAVQTQDMTVLEHVGLEALDHESIQRYRIRMKSCRPGHEWADLEEPVFLSRLGAAAAGKDGSLHPTAAGLLLFGFEREIVKVFPNFSLAYQEPGKPLPSPVAGQGNLYNVYFHLCRQLVRDLPLSEPPVRKALQEALANCLINADYHGRDGVVIVKCEEHITLSNPGAFRIRPEAARSGGMSDPRNGALSRMFRLIHVGEGTGSGLANLYALWQQQGWAAPSIRESFDPERITLSLPLQKGEPAARADGQQAAIKSAWQKAAIIDYLTDHVAGQAADFAGLLGVNSTQLNGLLAELLADGIVVANGSDKDRLYQLKA